MKIVYAAGNRKSSFSLLNRFIEKYGQVHSIRAAAYPSSIGNLFVDWNLESLLISRDGQFNFETDNYKILHEEIKEFDPDLIISDLDVFTSRIAMDLGYPLWQVSPFLLYFAAEGSKLNIFKKYSAYFRNNAVNAQILRSTILASDKRIVLSHLGDITQAPLLSKSFEYARPSYEEISSYEEKIIADPSLLADYYYAGRRHKLSIDYSDPASIVSGYYNIHYGLSNQPFNIELNEDVDFFSTLLRKG